MFTKRQFLDSCQGAKRHAGYVTAVPILSMSAIMLPKPKIPTYDHTYIMNHDSLHAFPALSHRDAKSVKSCDVPLHAVQC